MYVVVSPSPYPAAGGGAAAWSCTDVVGVSPYPSIWPSPQADLAPSSPKATTSPVWAKTGQDCAVTTWGTNPVPAPYPTPTYNTTVNVSSAPIPTSIVNGVDRASNVIPALGAYVIVLLAVIAGLQLRRAR